MVIFSFSLYLSQLSPPYIFISYWSSSTTQFASLISICLSLPQSSSPHPYHILLVLVPLLLLAMIFSVLILINSPTCEIILLVSSPHKYHFTYTCWNILLILCIVFSFYWFLCFSFSLSSVRISLSLHSIMIFFSLSLCLIDITSPLITIIVFSLSWMFCTCKGRLLLVLIPFLLLVTIVGALLLITIALVFPLFLCFWSTISNTKNMTRGQF